MGDWFDRATEWLRPYNDKYGTPVAVLAFIISLIALLLALTK